jgi:hypothetical protein
VFGHRVAPPFAHDSTVANPDAVKSGGVHIRPEPGDHAAALQPVEPCLRGAASDAEPPRCLEHTDPWLGGEQ